MGRIRTLKPELLEDEKAAGLSHLEWRVFVSCILLADDYGNFRAVPERVRGSVLWAHPREDVAKVIDRLAFVGLLKLYIVDGQSYAHIAGWEKHQKVDHPGKPLCPIPSEFSRDSRESVAKIPDTLAPDQDLDLRPRPGPGPVPGPVCAEPAEPASPLPLFAFPIVGNGVKEWGFTPSEVDLLLSGYPDLDVIGEARKALVWVQANPARRKTAKGMRAFLAGWMSRAQNRGHSNGAGVVPLPTKQQQTVAAAQRFLVRHEGKP